MNVKNESRKTHLFFWLCFIFFYMFINISFIKANATNYPVSISSTPFKYSPTGGMVVMIPGRGSGYLWCVQRGKPFRSQVSELQMLQVSIVDAYDNNREGLIPEVMRYLINNRNDDGDWLIFRGWGIWEMNGDATDGVLVSNSGAPTSLAWNEVFDEDGEDTEDPKYEEMLVNEYLKYGTPADVWKRSWDWTTDIKLKLTGHEGSISPYTTSVKVINYSSAGFSLPEVYAFAILNYYIFDDPDSAGYSDMTKWRVEQILSWSIQFGFITTTGGTGRNLCVVYNDSTGYTRGYSSSYYTGNVDGYVKCTINDYQDLKLYRQVVWKTNNMRMIPSFASNLSRDAEPIKLYWDENIRQYTATVSDANGVLDYFDFNVPGCSVVNNGDGTLTISTGNQLGGSITSYESVSRLEPADGIFKLPDFYRWSLEGTKKTLTYTALRDLKEWVGPDVKKYAPSSSENGKRVENHTQVIYEHSHDYAPPCYWFCDDDKLEEVTHCTKIDNRDWVAGHYTYHEHDSSCGSAEDGYPDCDDEDNAGWEEGHYTRHEHIDLCKHKSDCPYYQNKGSWEYVGNGITPSNDCLCVWCCAKSHKEALTQTITGTFIDWQDLQGTYITGQKIIDPTKCYIKVQTVTHEYPCETDTEILLIAENDEWNDLTYTMPNGKIVKHSSHLRVGEKFHIKYIYSYKGASKGFRVSYSEINKPYYNYTYLARMQAPNDVIPIYNLRSGLTGDRFAVSSIGIANAVLVQDLTDIKIRGIYTTPETAYTLNGVYKWDSESQTQKWNDKVYLDALVNDQWDDNYNNKPANSISSSLNTPLLTAFTVSKPAHNDMLVVWEFDTEPEVFSAAMVYATAYIDVGSDINTTKTYFDEAYNYGKENMWNYAFANEPHNNVGGLGYFSFGQSGELIPSHVVYTQNAELPTYAVRNKVWQSDVDIKVSNFVQNTGAGITEHIYQERGRDNHDMNYNLYYTIDVENPKATIFEHKIRLYDNRTESDMKTTPYNTSSDIYEFDVNNMISWGATGASQTTASYGNTVVVDHIKTGRTYIQREIPTVLATITNGSVEKMSMKIYPNYDRLVYEDYYTGVNLSTSGLSTTVSATIKGGYYPTNEQSAESSIYPAINPNVIAMQPSNITNSKNVPNKSKDEDNQLYHPGTSTQFTIQLSNGQVKTVRDSHTKTYTQYDFEYNATNRDNRVTFPTYRKSIVFFKYSKTNYVYNAKNDYSAVGTFKGNNITQKEAYYISQVLFKSNYITKYRKELEAKGATYIDDKNSLGQITNSWIDMVNQNEFAIVSAGQGFEIKVTVKYENNLLTQYLSRYFGTDDARNDTIGTSNRVQHKQLESTVETNRQFANISALTLPEAKYKDSERAYISSISTIDQLAVNLVTGSNVFNDLYVQMSDNKDKVYSYSGIYNTPVVFERNIKYSEDFSVTSITYTMKVSEQNGVASTLLH